MTKPKRVIHFALEEEPDMEGPAFGPNICDKKQDGEWHYKASRVTCRKCIKLLKQDLLRNINECLRKRAMLYLWDEP